MKKPDLNTFKKLCESKGGNITEMAKALDCSRRVVHKWIAKDERFKEIYEDVRESFLDLCESQSVNLIKGIPKLEKDENGNNRMTGWIERPSETLIIFNLKTRGKDRGYIERSEFTGKDGQPLMPKAPIPIIVMSPEEVEALKDDN